MLLMDSKIKYLPPRQGERFGSTIKNNNAQNILGYKSKIDIKDFSASIMVTNVLNKKYRNYLNSMRYFADEMGRNFIFNLSYTFRKKD